MSLSEETLLRLETRRLSLCWDETEELCALRIAPPVGPEKRCCPGAGVAEGEEAYAGQETARAGAERRDRLGRGYNRSGVAGFVDLRRGEDARGIAWRPQWRRAL
ncbi:MAG: hypothetical protein AAFZ09_12050 [Pseudomonadota bacterium]